MNYLPNKNQYLKYNNFKEELDKYLSKNIFQIDDDFINKVRNTYLEENEDISNISKEDIRTILRNIFIAKG